MRTIPFTCSPTSVKQEDLITLSIYVTRVPLFLLVSGVRLTLCQRRYLEHSRSPRPSKEIPRCRSDGSFEEVQCRGLMCFCVDPDNGRAVKETNINTLFGEPRCGETGRKPKSAFMQMKLVTQFQIKIAHERDGESVNAL